MSKRLAPADRKADILAAAISVAARRGGYNSMTRKAVADAAQCSEGLVSKYFETMPQMRRAVMRAAVAGNGTPALLSIVAQGLTLGDKQAQKAPAELRSKALATLAPKAA